MKTIDLNSDVGELPGPVGRELDREILSAVSSCNIACGGHAGDEVSMRLTLELARKLNVKAGAHPSYPDRAGFGRTVMKISPENLTRTLTEQILTLKEQAAFIEIPIHHLKPHGALYNQAARDALLAALVCRVTKEAGISVLVGPPDSELMSAAKRSGLKFCAEGFVDRSYEPDGSLTPRSQPGAVFEEIKTQVDQAVLIAAEHRVKCADGSARQLSVQTLCLHGDTSGAQKAALSIRKALEAQGFNVRPVS